MGLSCVSTQHKLLGAAHASNMKLAHVESSSTDTSYPPLALEEMVLVTGEESQYNTGAAVVLHCIACLLVS
jgi:hypothetical protein